MPYSTKFHLDSAAPGIVVEVRDSTSGQSTIGGSTLLIVSGAYQEQATYPASAAGDAYYLAYERAGRYAITVRKPDFAEWRGHGRGACRCDRG